MPTLEASLYLLQLVLKCIHLNEKTEALLKENITSVLESAGRVCTFEAHEDVKMELTKYFRVSFEELEKWFVNKFGKSFGADETAEREIKVQLAMLLNFMTGYIIKFLGSQLQILCFVDYFQIWNNILNIDIKCNQVLQMWQNDVVTKIVESRIEGVVCY